MGKNLVWYLLSLISPCMETLQQSGTLTPFCHWVFPTGDTGLWTGQEPPSHIPMARAIAAALLGVDPRQLPLEAGYPDLPWLSN